MPSTTETVYAVTDDTYRREFFTGVVTELERAIAVRAAYVAACRDRGHVIDEEAEAEVARRRAAGPASAEPVPEPLADDQPTRQLPLE